MISDVLYQTWDPIFIIGASFLLLPVLFLVPFLSWPWPSAQLICWATKERERARQKMRKKEDLEKQVGEQGTSEQEEQQAKFVKLSPGRNYPRVFPLVQRGQVHRGVPPPRPRHLTGSEGRAPRTWPSPSASAPGCGPRRPLSARPGRPGGAADPGTQGESRPIRRTPVSPLPRDPCSV